MFQSNQVLIVVTVRCETAAGCCTCWSRGLVLCLARSVCDTFHTAAVGRRRVIGYTLPVGDLFIPDITWKCCAERTHHAYYMHPHAHTHGDADERHHVKPQDRQWHPHAKTDTGLAWNWALLQPARWQEEMVCCVSWCSGYFAWETPGKSRHPIPTHPHVTPSPL